MCLWTDRTLLTLAILLGGVLLVTTALPALAQQPEPGVRVFETEDLAEAGVYRLSDLYWLVDDWTSFSVNAHTWHAAPAGLTDPEGADWMLFIDGRPVNAGALNTQDINNIPLRIQDIERVEISSRPRMVAGRAARGGFIHIHTSRPERVVEIKGAVAPGSEVGDPGPFEYTRHASQNVDRVGPAFGASIGSNPGMVYARGSLRGDERHSSNTIRPRVRTLCRGECIHRGAPVVRLRSYHGMMGAESRFGHHHLSHFRTALHDQLFFAPVGLEMPSDYSLVDTGIQWSAPLTETLWLHYDASHNSVTHAPLVEDAGFNFRQQRSELRVEVERRGNVYQDTFGFIGNYTKAESGHSLGRRTVATLNLYRTLSYQLSERWHQHLAGNVYVAHGEPGLDVLSTTSVTVAEGHVLSALASYSLRPPAAKQDLWYWMSEGYDAYVDPDRVERTPAILPEDLGVSRTLTADLFWEANVSRTVQLSVHGGMRLFRDLTIGTYAFGIQPNNHGLLSELTVHENARGTVGIASATATIRLLPGLEQRLHAGYQHVLDASEAFEQVWQKHPSLRIGYTVRYQPVPRFSLFGRVRYIDATDWPAYRAAGEEAPDWYSDRLPPSWQLHLSAQKHFWGDHLRLSLSLRNLLDKPMRFHPAAAPVDMSFFVSLELRI